MRKKHRTKKKVPRIYFIIVHPQKLDRPLANHKRQRSLEHDQDETLIKHRRPPESTESNDKGPTNDQRPRQRTNTYDKEQDFHTNRLLA